MATENRFTVSCGRFHFALSLFSGFPRVCKALFTTILIVAFKLFVTEFVQGSTATILIVIGNVSIRAFWFSRVRDLVKLQAHGVLSTLYLKTTGCCYPAA